MLRKVSLKDYMAVFCCSLATAKRYRNADKKTLGVSVVRVADLVRVYGSDWLKVAQNGSE